MTSNGIVPEISIIIPVYMAEEYLPRCIESILSQDFQNFELIMVDDNSPDNSGKICNDYAKKDDRIKVIHKEQQEGAGKARNLALSQAKGKYIGFVDSDDWIEKGMFDVLIRLIKDYDADIACCDFFLSYDDKEIPHKNTGKIDCYNMIESLKVLHQRKDLFDYVWNKLFKKETLATYNKEDEIIVGEDYSLVVETLQRCNKIVAIKQPLYHYYQRPDSISNVGFNLKRLRTIANYEYYYDTLKDKYPEIGDDVLRYSIVHKLAVIASMKRNDNYHKETIDKVKQDVRKNLFICLKGKNYEFPAKIGCLCLSIHERVFYFAHRFKR